MSSARSNIRFNIEEALRRELNDPAATEVERHTFDLDHIIFEDPSRPSEQTNRWNAMKQNIINAVDFRIFRSMN